jgi:hypothetical protein
VEQKYVARLVVLNKSCNGVVVPGGLVARLMDYVATISGCGSSVSDTRTSTVRNGTAAHSSVVSSSASTSARSALAAHMIHFGTKKIWGRVWVARLASPPSIVEGAPGLLLVSVMFRLDGQ